MFKPVDGRGVNFFADRLNRLQFLDHPPLSQPGLRNPRHAAAGARDMVVISDILVHGRADAAGAAARAALTGVVRKMKARLLRRQGPSILQPYRDLLRLLRKEVGAGRKRVVAVPRHALYHLRRDLGCRRAGADICHRPGVQLDCRPDRHRRPARRRALLPRRLPAWMSAPALAASAPAARS